MLVALAPECGPSNSAASCPTDILPPWLAYLTPWIDDAGSDEKWMETVFHYADLAAWWHVLTPEDWRRLDYEVRAICVREAMAHTTDAQALTACEIVVALCDRAARGEIVTSDEWAAAAAAKAAAAWAVAAAEEAAAEEAAAAKAAAADRMIKAILGAIEREIRAKLFHGGEA